MYSVSDQGRVRNDETGRVLKPRQGSHGRLQVELYREGACKSYLTHRLVLQAFVGPCPDSMEACHNDGNHQNNRLGNLRWDTKKNNAADRLKHGTHNRGERSGQAKLTEAQAYEIKFGNIPGTLAEVGALFGVGIVQVHKIRAGKRWAWLEKKSA